MPKFLIDRTIPGAGTMSPDEIREASATSCGALREIGPEIQWVQSYVTGDRITCVYIAESEDQIREHSRRSGIPADNIEQIRAVIDPTSAEPRPPVATS